MRKAVINNSKKGFSLPVAMAVSVFLILISSSLIFIAMQSMSNTSADVSGRQAYLNVKSALNYAEAYYGNTSNISDYSTLTTSQFMVMKDKGGTTSEGAKITSNVNETKSATTYVEAKYIEPVNSDPAKLRLTAYSKYSDAFGNKSKTVRLSITFTVGASAPNRLTVIAVPPKGKSSDNQPKITLNVKQPKGMNYQLSYYVWTYNDVEKAYEGFYDQTAINSYEWDKKHNNSTFLGKLNAATTKDTEVKPNGVWAKGGDKQGPPAIMGMTSDNDMWTRGDYIIRTDRVPWFNIIFAQKGSVLGHSCDNIYNSQTNEMFHLWYLDPSDKNIYFEFTGKIHNKDGHTYYTRYYTGKAWDGYEGLDDTILVYVRNMKTAVHFRAKGDNEYDIAPAAGTQPTIKSIKLHGSSGGEIDTTETSYIEKGTTKKNANIPMYYEGCGWWVANVETNKTFDITITYKDVDYSIVSGVDVSDQDEAWIVLKDGELLSFTDEERAAEKVGISSKNYVTIHAKVYDYTNGASPKLSFANGDFNNSAKKQILHKTILKCSTEIKADAYEDDDKWAAYQAAYNDAVTSYNKSFASFAGDNYAEKIKNADNEFDQKNTALVNAKKKLNFKQLTQAQIKPLQDLVNDANTVINEYNTSGKYDDGKIREFKKTGSYYDQAVKALKNTKAMTLITLNELKTGLGDALNGNADKGIESIYSAILDRGTLENSIKRAKQLVDNEDYGATEREALREALPDAEETFKQLHVSQETLDGQNTILTGLISAVEGTLSNLTEEYNAAKSEAEALLNRVEKVNCTDDSYTTLQTVYNQAKAEAEVKGASKETVDNATAKLNIAIKDFTITKPVNSNDNLMINGKIRVWVIAKSDVLFDIEQYVDTTTPAGTIITSADMEPQSETGYYYYDVDKVKYSMVKLRTTVINGAEETVTESDPCLFVDHIDGNICFVVGDDGKITLTKLTSVYFPEREGTFTAFFNDNEEDSVNSVYEGPYYVFRYPVNSKKVTVSITKLDEEGHVHASGYDFPAFTDGDMVIKIKAAHGAAVDVNAASIYPKYDTPAAPSSPSPSGTVANGGYMIQNVSTTMAEEFGSRISVGENQTCIILDATGSASGITSGGNPRIYVWAHDGSGLVGSWDSRPSMNRLSGTNYYYYVVPANFKGLKVTKANGDFSAESSIVRENETDPVYRYVKLTSRSTAGYFDIWKELPTVDDSSDHTEIDSSGDDLTSQFPDIGLSEGESVIILHIKNNATKLTQAGNPPWIYCWGYVTNTTLGNAWHGQPMLRYKNTDYYYHTVDANVVGCKLTYANGDHYSGSGDANNINLRSADEIKYKYYLLEPVSASNDPHVNVKKYQYPPTIIEEPDIVTVDEMDGTGIPLQYVGGRKVRVQNQGYCNVFNYSTTGKKTNDYGYGMNAISYKSTEQMYWDSNNDGVENGGYMFGGDKINKNSGGRVGSSYLSAYYDWYEVKIPVPDGVSYTFELQGMNKDDANRKTVQVANANGNVWLSQLDNTTKSDNRYSNVDLLTFDPEVSQIGEKLTVFFRMPSGWSNLRFQANGTGGNVNKTVTTQLTRGENKNIYYIDNLSKNTPFITFTVDTVDETDKVYKTSLRGGDYVLFDPTVLSTGDWVPFVSDEEQLNKSLKKLMSMYYGNSIVHEYNSEALVVDHDNNTYHYSGFLGSVFSDYANGIDSTGGTYYQLKSEGQIRSTALEKTSFLSGKTVEERIYYEASRIKAIVEKYEGLYQAMSDAKTFIPTMYDSDYHKGGGVFPEYNSSDNKDRVYKAGSLAMLKSRLIQAEAAYLADSDMNGSRDNIIDTTNYLNRAIDAMDVESEGAIAVVLYDAQDRVSDNSVFELKYNYLTTDYAATAEGTAQVYVTDKNPERYPIIFIPTKDLHKDSSGKKKIYNVQFIVDGDPIGSPRADMQEDEAWVFVDRSPVDGKEMGYWTKNSTSDYRQINHDLYSQEDSSDTMIFEMQPRGSSYEPMTILFMRDVEVRRVDKADYVIKAGAYYFSKSDQKPISGAKLDVFSDDAYEYFTDAKNYGAYESDQVNDAIEVGWLEDDPLITNDPDDPLVGLNFSPSRNTSSNQNVYFEAKTGSLTAYVPQYEFSSSEEIYFRWSSDSPLEVSADVEFTANSYKFASMGVIDATVDESFLDPQFLLYNYSGGSKVDVTFVTDVYVKYYDHMHKLHEFVIREGSYTLKKSTVSQDYIANIFDETYWKGMKDIEVKGRGGSITTGVTSGLHNGTYGD